jgi:hypothetical protein
MAPNFDLVPQIGRQAGGQLELKGMAVDTNNSARSQKAEQRGLRQPVWTIAHSTVGRLAQSYKAHNRAVVPQQIQREGGKPCAGYFD